MFVKVAFHHFHYQPSTALGTTVKAIIRRRDSKTNPLLTFYEKNLSASTIKYLWEDLSRTPSIAPRVLEGGGESQSQSMCHFNWWSWGPTIVILGESFAKLVLQKPEGQYKRLTTIFATSFPGLQGLPDLIALLPSAEFWGLQRLCKGRTCKISSLSQTPKWNHIGGQYSIGRNKQGTRETRDNERCVRQKKGKLQTSPKCGNLRDLGPVQHRRK